METFVVAALYKFVSLPDYKEIRDSLFKKCQEEGIKGTLLLAYEGINGTIAGTRQGIDNLMNYLYQDKRFHDLEYKESSASSEPFYRLKVRLKKEIVTLGIPEVDPNKTVGTYVEAKEWNDLIQQDDVIVIDTRNDYECRIGTFKGAIDPKTKTFREFPDYVKQNLNPHDHRRIAMYCTGGIRCEKASSYLLEQGFEHVYHLKGGILKYLENIPQEESLWDGECFVFDNRTALSHGIKEGEYIRCYGCREPLSVEEKSHPHFKEGVHCSYCYGSKSENKLKRAEDRHAQVLLAKKRHQDHLGSSHRKKNSA